MVHGLIFPLNSIELCLYFLIQLQHLSQNFANPRLDPPDVFDKQPMVDLLAGADAEKSTRDGFGRYDGYLEDRFGNHDRTQ